MESSVFRELKLGHRLSEGNFFSFLNLLNTRWRIYDLEVSWQWRQMMRLTVEGRSRWWATWYLFEWSKPIGTPRDVYCSRQEMHTSTYFSYVGIEVDENRSKDLYPLVSRLQWETGFQSRCVSNQSSDDPKKRSTQRTIFKDVFPLWVIFHDLPTDFLPEG